MRAGGRAGGRARCAPPGHPHVSSPPSHPSCFGGYQTTAFDWLFARGGAALQSDYPYRGVNGLCDDAAPDGAAFSGKYVWVGGGSDGLKAALMAKGPMTVSVDASAQDFTL